MIPPLKIIYTKSMEEEKVLDKWKVGHISVIHKSGSRSKAENYRLLSLTSVPGKIMERLTRDHIVDPMTKNNFFPWTARFHKREIMQHPVTRIFRRSYRGLGCWKTRRRNLS